MIKLARRLTYHIPLGIMTNVTPSASVYISSASPIDSFNSLISISDLVWFCTHIHYLKSFIYCLMKITFLFVSCLLTCATEAKSDFKSDAKEILRLLQNAINGIDNVSDCYAIAHKANTTVGEMRRCMQRVVRANLSKPKTVTPVKVRSSHQRHHHFRSRPGCRRFGRSACWFNLIIISNDIIHLIFKLFLNFYPVLQC